MLLTALQNDIENRINSGKRVIVAIDGMAAAGKSTLANSLADCNAESAGRRACVIHMDHFFLRPEQRVPERFAQPGGNIDYERFSAEVIAPLRTGDSFSYRPYDCTTGQLGRPVAVNPGRFIIIEGVYSMHPLITSDKPENLYDITVFMKISDAAQRERLSRRSPSVLQRFIDEWIPLENKYFSHFNIAEKCMYLLEE